jgi:hypothetical protein
MPAARTGACRTASDDRDEQNPVVLNAVRYARARTRACPPYEKHRLRIGIVNVRRPAIMNAPAALHTNNDGWLSA